jgi:hypothetical protein
MGFLHRTLRRRTASGATVGDFLAEAGRLASALTDGGVSDLHVVAP